MQYSSVNIALNSSIFQVIFAVRPITLVVGKISYEDKLRSRHRKKLVLDAEQFLQNCRKMVGSFAQ